MNEEKSIEISTATEPADCKTKHKRCWIISHAAPYGSISASKPHLVYTDTECCSAFSLYVPQHADAPDIFPPDPAFVVSAPVAKLIVAFRSAIVPSVLGAV